MELRNFKGLIVSFSSENPENQPIILSKLSEITIFTTRRQTDEVLTVEILYFGEKERQKLESQIRKIAHLVEVSVSCESAPI